MKENRLEVIDGRILVFTQAWPGGRLEQVDEARPSSITRTALMKRERQANKAAC